MAIPILVEEATLTARYQTTVPKAVRNALHLKKNEKIQYIIKPDNSVEIVRVDKDNVDPILCNFLTFLAKDMQLNPQRLEPISQELVSSLQNLVGNVEVNLDAPLSDEDE